MATISIPSFKNNLPDLLYQEFYHSCLPESFSPIQPSNLCPDADPVLVTLDLHGVLNWLHQCEAPISFEKEICATPVLLYVPKFSTQRLLFHYDGTPNSAELIRKFIGLFQNTIRESRATIISPSFIPKSKLKEEQELIHLVTNYTKETSFIKFNFSKIGDFWSYATREHSTLLVTTKAYQIGLARVLFHFYRGKLWNEQLSFYLSI